MKKIFFRHPLVCPIGYLTSGIGWVAISCGLMSLVGCAMCCGPHDYDYPAYGGKHQRVDPTYGRVGSVLSDPIAAPMLGSPDQYTSGRLTTESSRGDSLNVPDRNDGEDIRQRIRDDLEQRQPGRSGLENLPLPDDETASEGRWRFR